MFKSYYGDNVTWLLKMPFKVVERICTYILDVEINAQKRIGTDQKIL